MTGRIGLLVATVAYLALAGLVPAVRLRRSAGIWGFPLIDRGASLAQRLVSAGIGICAAGLLVWAGLFAALGAARMHLWDAPAWVTGSGWVCMTSGLAIIVAAQAQMGASWRIGIDRAPTTLITHGLFAVIRNPIFAAGGISLLGLVLLAPSSGVIMIAASLAALVQIQVRLEEQHLLHVHGDRYLAYASKVGRFLPGIGRLERRAGRK